jgi:hypothetical protein
MNTVRLMACVTIITFCIWRAQAAWDEDEVLECGSLAAITALSTLFYFRNAVSLDTHLVIGTTIAVVMAMWILLNYGERLLRSYVAKQVQALPR